MMKRKALFIGGTVILTVAIILMISFALGGNEAKEQNTDYDFDGTWRVVVYTKNREASIIENEFMVFNGDLVTDYRDGKEIITTQYTINNNRLVIPDISKTYVIEKRTDYLYRLCESPEIYMDLVKWPDNEQKELSFAKETLTGKWMISFRVTDKPYKGDYLVFDNEKANQFLAGGESPVSTAEYTVEGIHLKIDAWNKDMVVLPISDNILMLVELSDYRGYIWELTKAE